MRAGASSDVSGERLIDRSTEWLSDGTGIVDRAPVRGDGIKFLALFVGLMAVLGLGLTSLFYAATEPTDTAVPSPPMPPDIRDVFGTALTIHAPVVIDNNADFTEQGWPGTGTESDPYTISELEINATAYRAGIFIGNTSAYFVVESCLIYSAMDVGIHLLNMVNGAVLNNTCQNNPWYGIVLYDGVGVRIENNTCSGSTEGIHIQISDDCTIMSNVCSNLAENGIYMESSFNNTISWNSCSGNGQTGISLVMSSSCTVAHNACDYNVEGISLYNSCDDAVLVGNSCSDGGYGVKVTSSDNVSIRDGLARRNQAWMNPCRGISMLWSNGSDIVDYDCSSTFGDGIYIDRCDDIVVMDCVSSDNVGSGSMLGADPGDGVYAWDCNNPVFVNVICDRNLGLGFDLWYDSNARIENCSGSTNYRYGGSVKHESYGLKLSSSPGCVVTNSTFNHDDWAGIMVWGEGFSASNCSASFNNNIGIILGSSNSSIVDCNMSSNLNIDLHITDSVSVCLRNNVMNGWGLSLAGTDASHWNSHDIDATNIVNGRPVIYWKNATSGTLPLGASQVILGGCTGVTVEQQTISGVHYGILLGFSSSNTIRNNTCSNDRYGIYLRSSNGNSFFWNSLVANSVVGLYINSGDNNVIWNNSFLSNVKQADEAEWPLNNWWNITGRGNYWSEWTSPDINYDGIVDNPYRLPAGNYDYYPLAGQPEGIPEFGGMIIPIVCVGFIVLFVAALPRKRA